MLNAIDFIIIGLVILFICIFRANPPLKGGIYFTNDNYDIKMVGIDQNIENIIFQPNKVFHIHKLFKTSWTYYFVTENRQKWFITFLASDLFVLKTPDDRLITFYFLN
jgi:hypothetical protein